MRRISAAIVVGVFFAVVAFGVFAMNHSGGHDVGNCIAAAVQGSGACPGAGNLIAFLEFHLGAFKGLSIAAVAALGSFLLMFMLEWTTVSVSPPAHSRFGVGVHPNRARVISKIDFVRWLALHENSPAIS